MFRACPAPCPALPFGTAGSLNDLLRLTEGPGDWDLGTRERPGGAAASVLDSTVAAAAFFLLPPREKRATLRRVERSIPPCFSCPPSCWDCCDCLVDLALLLAVPLLWSLLATIPAAAPLLAPLLASLHSLLPSLARPAHRSSRTSSRRRSLSAPLAELFLPLSPAAGATELFLAGILLGLGAGAVRRASCSPGPGPAPGETARLTARPAPPGLSAGLLDWGDGGPS